MAYYGFNTTVDFSLKKKNENNKVKINKNLLKGLLTIQSVSHDEGDITKFVLQYIKSLNITCSIDIDEKGNLMVTKGTTDFYPCFISHLDEVTSNTKESNRSILELNNVLIGINKNTGKPAGCPGD